MASGQLNLVHKIQTIPPSESVTAKVVALFVLHFKLLMYMVSNYYNIYTIIGITRHKYYNNYHYASCKTYNIERGESYFYFNYRISSSFIYKIL